MAYDFPASPTQGQQFNPSAGVSYVYNGYAWDLLSGPTAPVSATRIVPLTSGSGTYTVTPGTTLIQVELVGGGGGGGGGGSSTPGGNGGNTTFGPFTAGGGGGSHFTAAGSAGVGSGGQINLAGSAGGPSIPGFASTWGGTGGNGGSSYFGGAGTGVNAAQGTNAGANSGSGGGGGGMSASITSAAGFGGSSGGFCSAIIASPAASYSYSVGAAGTGAAAGTGGAAGGAGGSGLIVVTEYGGSAAQAVTVPKITSLLSGSGNFTTSPGAVAMIVEMVGGGGGGGGGGVTPPTVGGNTTFGSLLCNGGGHGQQPFSAPALNGGTASGGDINITGQDGGTVTSIGVVSVSHSWGGEGGQSPFGGGGRALYDAIVSTTQNAKPNTGSGGAGGGTNAAVATGGMQGGGAGGYLRKLITNPAATYSYAVGSGGTGSPASGNTYAGGNGAAGIIIVTEFIQQGGAAAAALPGGRVLISSQTVSAAVAAVTFTSGIDSTYDEYELTYFNVLQSADANVTLRISQDGGATYKAGATDYTWSFGFTGAAGSAVGFVGSGAGAPQITLGIAQSGVSSYGGTGKVRLSGLSTTIGHLFRYDTACFNTGGTLGTTRSSGTGGYNGDSNPINALRVGLTAGNFTKGTFNLYGIKK